LDYRNSGILAGAPPAGSFRIARLVSATEGEPMPRALRLTCAALLAAIPLLLVACGSSADNDYVDSVNKVTAQLQSDVSQIASQANVNSPKQAAAVFGQVSDKVDAAAADLEEITPPDKVSNLHAKLVSEMQQLGSEAKGAADDIDAGGPGATPGVLSQFVNQARRLDAQIRLTITEINNELGK